MYFCLYYSAVDEKKMAQNKYLEFIIYVIIAGDTSVSGYKDTNWLIGVHLKPSTQAQSMWYVILRRGGLKKSHINILII